jgi:cell division protein FtsZ
VVDTFRISNRFLADGVQGIWRSLTLRGLIPIHTEALVRLLQDQHVECSFAVAQALGADRGAKVIEKLLAHPMLDNGEALAAGEAAVVSLVGGPDLTMAEVNQVMDQVRTRCDSAQILMGAGIDPALQDRLAVTIIVAKKTAQEVASRAAESLETQLLHRGAAAKPNSRLLPPAPELPPEQVKQILARQATGRSLGRRASRKMRQAQLPLEIVSKGRFDKSEPTIHKGEDLDVPTYLRRGVSLN